MPSSNVCWGIEIGAGAVKGVKLVRDGDDLKVADFAYIPHKRVLSDPDIDQTDVLRVAMGALVHQHDLSGATLAISVPGHAAFARFIKLPPAEPKEIPNLVKFEAGQQVPFPLEEVEWDYQTFASDDSPDIEVGIFAISRERVMERLALCADVGLEPECLTLSPIAAYNAVAYDQRFTEDTPGTVILDVGASATDLIVAEAGRVWVRTFPLGGHQFTEALTEAFKLEYRKAEKLKKEAEKHEHKRHIFQAMRPVFADLAQDVQRSLSYYKQLHPEAKLNKVIALGSTFRLMGLRKFLSQQLQLDVVRLGEFDRLKIEGAKESDFQALTSNMATAYGLALQGLGMSTINANLVPVSVLRTSIWKRKTPWFVAAAGLAVLAGGVSFYQPIMEQRAVEAARSDPAMRVVDQVKNRGRTLTQQWQEVEQNAQIGAAPENIKKLAQRQDVYAFVAQDIGAMFAAAMNAADAGEGVPFELRKLDVQYVTPGGEPPRGPGAAVDDSGRRRDSGDEGRGRGGGGGLGMGTLSRGRDERPTRGDDGQSQQASIGPYGALNVTLTVESDNSGYLNFVDRTLLDWLRDHAERADVPYTISPPNIDEISVEQVGDSQRQTTGAAGSRPATGGGGGVGTNQGRNRGRTSDGESAAPGSIEELAPLPSTDLQPRGELNRYIIRWRARLKAPGEHRAAGEQSEQQASAQEAME